jgi:hypothetical protein
LVFAVVVAVVVAVAVVRWMAYRRPLLFFFFFFLNSILENQIKVVELSKYQLILSDPFLEFWRIKPRKRLYYYYCYY